MSYLEAPVPFASLNDTSEKSKKNHSDIHTATNQGWSGAKDLTNSNALPGYMMTLGFLEQDKLTHAQSTFINFGKTLKQDLEDKTIAPEDVLYLVEHLMGRFYFAQKELTELKEAQADTMPEPTEPVYLGHRTQPFSYLVEALVSDDRKDKIEQIISADYSDFTKDPEVRDPDYNYQDQIIGYDENSDSKILKNHKAIAEDVKMIGIYAEEADLTAIPEMQEEFRDFANKVEKNKMTGVELLPVVEFFTAQLFLAKAKEKGSLKL